jgi:hypothetical protein
MSNGFQRIQPVSLFETTWGSRDLESLKGKPGVGDLKREVALPPSNHSMFANLLFGQSGRSVEVEHDIWGADWTTVPETDWATPLPDRIFDFETAYLQFQITITAGLVGDSILFAYNAPTHDIDEGIHAYTDLQIPSFGSQGPVNSGSVRTVSRHLTDGFAFAQDHDNPTGAVLSSTKVSLYGVGRTDQTNITVECVMLGGFPAGA